MTIRIDTIDPTATADLADAAAIITAYWREVLGPDEPEYPATAIVHEYLRPTRDDIDGRALLARDDRTGRAVGVAVTDMRTGQGNEHLTYVPELYVLPDHRRQGVGRRLLDEVVSISRAAGRTLVMGAHPGSSEAGRAFAAAVGAAPSNAERQNRVRTADLDRALLESWLEPAAGYSLLSWDGGVPDEHVDAFVALQNTMNDAPRSDALEEFRFTVDKLRKSEAERALDGRHQWLVVARHDATGELAGYTELVHGRHRPWLVDQGDTAVAAAHRGHGLGRLLKATNALRVLDERPDAVAIETWNDGSNRWMLAINEAMGFRCVAEWHDTELPI